MGGEYVSGENDDSSGNIIKASFHPMSSSHVVMLIKRYFLLIDISNSNGDVQVFPLGVKDNFVSYCFGPSIDWMKFSIFLLSDRKCENAEVFCLCPVIPKDIPILKSSVRDLWAWVDEQYVFQDDQKSSGGNYFDRVGQYITAAFGPRNLLEKENDGRKISPSSFIRVGEYASNSGNLYIEMEGVFSATPDLQGPFFMTENCSEKNLELVPNSPENIPQNIPQKQKQKVKRIATDIATPITRGEGAPVLAISFDNGDVDLLIIRSEVMKQ